MKENGLYRKIYIKISLINIIENKVKFYWKENMSQKNLKFVLFFGDRPKIRCILGLTIKGRDKHMASKY